MSDVSLTLFDSIFDNKTDKKMEFSSFKEFENLLYKLSEIPRASKRDSHLISPACYKEGTNRRCNENVSHWTAWAAMDVDAHNFDSENLQNDLCTHYGHYNFVCYSTASSSSDLPKFRMVFPLSREVRADRIRHFWFALNKELGEIGDPQTKDLSRMYYIPAKYANAHNFIFSNHSGTVIDPAVLMQKYEYIETGSTAKNFLDRLPKEMQQQILEHRKNSMQRNAQVRWSGYQDCPFVNQSLIKEYKAIAYTDNSGRYAMIYKIMVSIAANAVRDGYAITENEIVDMIRQLDMETTQRYQTRSLDVEANRALEFAYRNL